MNVRCEGNTESVREVMCTSNVSKCLCSSLGAILGPRLCASRKCNRMFNISASMLYSTSSNEDTRELFLALCAPPTSYCIRLLALAAVAAFAHRRGWHG